MNFYRINFRDIFFQYCGWSRFIQYQFDSISISWTMSYLSKRRDNLLKGVSSDGIQAWWVIEWKVFHHFRFSIPPFNPRNGKIIPFNPHNSNAFRIPLRPSPSPIHNQDMHTRSSPRFSTRKQSGQMSRTNDFHENFGTTDLAISSNVAYHEILFTLVLPISILYWKYF